MKKISCIIILCLCSLFTFGWGHTGHRTVAKVAQNHLSKKAKKALREIMGHESLVEASTWMDNIKSDKKYDYARTWHYVTIPEGKNYASSTKNEKGDAYETIDRMVEILKKEGSNMEEKRNAVRMLTHLVGDFHQPLHVGNGEDKGGNDVKIKWFYSKSNLHRIWDSGMIDSKDFSYTELALLVDHPEESTGDKIATTDKNIWISEAVALRPQIYAIGEKDYLSYDYMYKNWDTVKEQLYKGGIRLAHVLNEIYD